MSTSPAEQRKAEHKEGRDDLVQYVEELAGPEEYPEGDAWISLTDAARITRTSEAMARRWVTSGRIPVKKEPVGVPPRTRLVRLSDVAKIRPIVDPTAAITGDVRKLDLPSIPRQQLQIRQDHERLTRQIELALEASKQHEASTHAALEQVTARLRELSEDLSQRLSTHRDELQRALNQAEQQHEALAAVVRDQAHRLEQSRDELADQATHHQQELEQLRAELVGQLHTAQATLQQAQQELERRLIEQANQVDYLRRDLKEQQEALVTLRRDMTTFAQQQMREVWTALEQVKRDQAQDGAQRNARLEKVEQRIEQVATQTEAVQITALGSQQRADGQESRLQEVWKLLQGEIAARQALEQQVQRSLPTRKRTSL
jgi:chromosome segregation ATPase